jgi:fibronectin-binding autotransporter adhesin
MMKKLLAGSIACLFMLGITSIVNGAVTETGDVTWDGVVRWRVGDTSVGSVTIDGATVKDAQYVDIGYASGAVGTMNVTGAGSSLNNTNIMEVGFEAGSQGTINVTDGGLVESYELTKIGVEGTGTVNLSGTGSKMIAGYRPSTFNRFTIVGNSGDSQGTVNINPGTSFEAADNLHVGYFDNSQGTVNVLGGSLSVAGELLVGHQDNSKGTLIVDNGVVDIAENMFLGYTASSEGIANISNGSTVTLGDDLVLGLNLTNGTTTKSTMNITGAETTVSVTDRVVIGFGQAPTRATEALLSVGRGASMDASRFVVAWSSWDTGTLQFIIGDDGTGTTASGLINAGEFGIGTGTSLFDLALDPSTSLMVGDVFTLVDYDTWDGDLFTNVADGGVFSVGDYRFLIDYDNDLGAGDMALTATVIPDTVIPEPATMSLLALGGLAILRRRRS